MTRGERLENPVLGTVDYIGQPQWADTFDYPLYIVKYNTQQLLNSHLNSELGTNFLSTAIIEDICNVFVRWTGRAKVEEWSQHKDRPDSAFVDKMNTTVKEEARCGINIIVKVQR